MSSLLQISFVAACLLLLYFVVKLVRRGKLQLKYALLWLTLACAILACSLFPQIAFSLTHFFGFETPSNFIFVVGLFFLLAITLSLGVLTSKQTVSIKNLTQRLALLEHEYRQDAKSKDGDKDASF